MVVPQGANRRWSLDFASDALQDNRRFRILCVIDDFTGECLATVVDNSLSGVRVGRELDRLCATRGRTDTIVSDKRHRTHLECHPEVATGRPGRLALHRPRQTDAERVR